MRSRSVLRVLVGIIVLSSALVVSSVVWAQRTDTVLETDVVYVTRGDTKLLLDIARPAAQKGKSPALLFVHGWAPGYDKSQHRNDILLAMARGYVGVAMSYRLPPVPGATGQAAVFPEPIYDVKQRCVGSARTRSATASTRAGSVSWASPLGPTWRSWLR